MPELEKLNESLDYKQASGENEWDQVLNLDKSDLVNRNRINQVFTNIQGKNEHLEKLTGDFIADEYAMNLKDNELIIANMKANITPFDIKEKIKWVAKTITRPKCIFIQNFKFKIK